MALDEDAARARAEQMLPAANGEWYRLGLLEDYYHGRQARPYAPQGARWEYRELIARSITNWLPLVVHTISQRLIVDGFHSTLGAATDQRAWQVWQNSQLDGRQRQQHLETLKLGYSFAFVWPAADGGLPHVAPASPLRVFAEYDDADDEWPTEVIRLRGKELVLYDADAAYVFEVKESGVQAAPGAALRMEEHALGIPPVVRFRTNPDLTGGMIGEIEPLIPITDRINDTVFSLLMAQQYAAFRQRWVTGMEIPRDPVTGEEVEPFSAAVQRLWIGEDPEIKFGEFGQTDLSGYLASYDSGIRSLSAIAQVPPHYLLGEMANLSAEALTAAESALAHKVDDRQTALGESWEQTLRLCGLAMGDEALWSDAGCTVRWRNTEARSMAATADALGKLAQMLGVPPRALWELVPGVTPEMVARWTEMAEEVTDPLTSLAAELERQAGPDQPATTGIAVAAPGAPEE